MSDAKKVEVTATPSILIYYLLQEVGKYLPSANAVYQPSLSYADGLRALREENSRKQLVDTTALPLLLFNRSTIRNSEVFNKRARLRASHPILDVSGQPTPDHDQFRVLMGEMDFRFLYVTTSMEELERFELLYMTGVEVKNVKKIKITLPLVGELEYKIDWQSLEDFELSIDDGYYKTIGATAKVTGPFVVSMGEKLALIRDIYGAGAVNIHIHGSDEDYRKALRLTEID